MAAKCHPLLHLFGRFFFYTNSKWKRESLRSNRVDSTNVKLKPDWQRVRSLRREVNIVNEVTEIVAIFNLMSTRVWQMHGWSDCLKRPLLLKNIAQTTLKYWFYWNNAAVKRSDRYLHVTTHQESRAVWAERSDLQFSGTFGVAKPTRFLCARVLALKKFLYSMKTNFSLGN